MISTRTWNAISNFVGYVSIVVIGLLVLISGFFYMEIKKQQELEEQAFKAEMIMSSSCSGKVCPYCGRLPVLRTIERPPSR